MEPAGLPIVAVGTDSAWVVIVAVSAITLVATLVVRQFVRARGGLAAGVLLALPLVVPVIAAALFATALLPEIAVLRPLDVGMLEAPELLNFVFVSVSDGSSDVRMPYAIYGSPALWVLLVGGAITSVALIRRALGSLLMRRLIARCTPCHEARLLTAVEDLSRRARLRRTPQLFVLPPRVGGAFAIGLRRPRVLVSRDLLDELDDDEAEAIVAHELAHIAARDVQLVFVAGLLRDLVAWNPFGHVAFRNLTRDREIEADRHAASLTGRPLSLASGLLKVCERVDRRPRGAQRAALSLASRRGAIAARVAGLIEIADGRVVALRSATLPYLLGALLVATLGLQAGARIAEQDPVVYGLVWGTPYATKAEVWSPRGVKSNHAGERGQARKHLGHPERYLKKMTGVAVREKDVSRWMRRVMRVSARTQLPASALQRELRPSWQAEPMWSSPGLAPISVIRIELRMPLDPQIQ